MLPDPTLTAAANTAEVSALIATIVQVLKPFLPGDSAPPTQTDWIRLFCALLGAILVPLAQLTGAGAVVNPQAVFQSVSQGLVLGYGVTMTVAGLLSAPAVASSVLARAPRIQVAPPADPAPEKPASTQ